MEKKSTRIPTVFHEDFSLSRQSVAKVIKVIFDNSEFPRLSQSERNKIFEERTSLGKNYIKAMPIYAMGCGFIGRNYTFSHFGQSAFLQDNNFDLISTQWLMHYYLSARQGPGPIFWHQVVSKFFYPGNVFTKEEIVEFIGNFIWQTENRILSKRKVQSTANIFLGTYTKPEGLGKLRLLETTESGRYRVQAPVIPPTWAVAYAFLDFWEAYYEGRISLGLDTLKDSGFAQLFLMGKSDVDEVLQSLQEIRYVEIHRTAPPFQVVLLRQDREPILGKLYGSS